MTVTERHARASDPPASQEAGAKEYLGDSALRVLRTLVEVERTNPHRVGGTANEIQMRMSYDSARCPDRGSVSRRLTSLVRHGFVVDAGVRRDGGRGVEVHVYRVTAAGRSFASTKES